MSDRTASGTRLRWHDHVLIALSVVAIRMLGATWRITHVGSDAVAEHRAARRAMIFAFWHGQMLPLLLSHRDEGITLLASTSRDGELISRIAHAFGCPTIRGSTSREATGALRALARVLSAGREVGVTTDGPRGPAHEFAPGAAIAARSAGVPVMLIAAAARRAWHLRSWDRFMIPKPFTTIVVAHEAVSVEGPHARDAVAQAPTLGSRLDALEARAQAAANRGGIA